MPSSGYNKPCHYQSIMPQILFNFLALCDPLFLSSVHGPHTPEQTPMPILPCIRKIHLTCGICNPWAWWTTSLAHTLQSEVWTIESPSGQAKGAFEEKAIADTFDSVCQCLAIADTMEKQKSPDWTHPSATCQKKKVPNISLWRISCLFCAPNLCLVLTLRVSLWLHFSKKRIRV